MPTEFLFANSASSFYLSYWLKRKNFCETKPSDTDQHTGRSRGFCFIVYKEVASLRNAVGAGDHVVKGKKVAVKKANAKQGKVHISKLKPELSDEEIREFFEQYGAIAGVEQPYDKVKQERKNFCFITFEKEETAKKLLKVRCS